MVNITHFAITAVNDVREKLRGGSEEATTLDQMVCRSFSEVKYTWAGTLEPWMATQSQLCPGWSFLGKARKALSRNKSGMRNRKAWGRMEV